MSRYPLSIVDVFDSLFNKSFNDFFNSGYEEVYSSSFPPLDIYIDKEKKDLQLDFALAGYSKEEIDLKFGGDWLYLDLKPINKEEETNLVRWKKGIKKSKVSIKYGIPSARYDQDNSKITFKDGILRIVIPALPEKEKKKLTIE